MSSPKKYDSLISILAGGFIGILCFFSISFLGQIYFTEEEQEIKGKNQIELERLTAEIERSISEKLYLAKSIAGFVQYIEDVNPNAYQDFASEIYKIGKKEIQSIQLVKDSIIQFNYPIEGNEKTIGQNILSMFEDRDFVEKSIAEKKPLLLGPRMLIQGMPGLVYREPIIIDKNGQKSLWGFAAIVIDIKAVFKNLNLLKNSQISAYSDNPTMFNPGFFIGDSTILETAYVKNFVRLPGNDWSIYLSFEDQLQAAKSQRNTLLIFSLFISMILSFFFGRYIHSLRSTFSLNFQLQEQNKKIESQLKEKVFLIEEIHHRIKNHFQLISSLNKIIYEENTSKEVRQVIQEVNSRILTLSEAYDQFDTNKRIETNMHDYLESLLEKLLNGTAKDISYDANIEPVLLDGKKTVYVGIILNEMATNSIKHAFPDGKGQIRVILKQHENKIELLYSDNGKGLPQDYLTRDFKSSGTEMIKLFTEQLEGSIRQFKDDNWSGLAIEFPE